MYIMTSRKELVDIFKSWLAVSFAFAVVMQGLGRGLLLALSIALMTVGLGFIIHELSHKLVAQKFRCWAEFRSDDKMLILAVLMSFLGFVFAAPGAVFIRGHISRKQSGLISSAGPAANIVLSVFFIAIFLSASNPWFQIIGSYGFRINAWLALFNLIPLGIFDGAKIWRWSRSAFFVLAAAALALIVVQNII